MDLIEKIKMEIGHDRTHRSWRIVQGIEGIVLIGLLGLAGWVWMAPAATLPQIKGLGPRARAAEGNEPAPAAQGPSADEQADPLAVRQGLFRAPGPLRVQAASDKTVDKIVSQLRLQCIQVVEGRPCAYVSIKGMGLRRGFVGDTVEDRFRVLEIREKAVDIEVLGQTVELSL